MSQSDNAHKYEYLNAMSTEQLRELLQLEIESDQDNDELVLQILGVIKKRNKEEQTDSPSWQQTRSDYDKYFNTPDGKGQQLYPTKIDCNDAPKKRSTTSIIRWISAIAAVLVLVIFVMPPALGYSDVWDMVAWWDDNALVLKPSVSSDKEINTVYGSFQDILSSYGAPDYLAPTFVPDGFSLKSIDIQDRSKNGERFFHIVYGNKDEATLIYTAIKRQNTVSRVYEKDSNLAYIYTINNIEHYIISNNNSNTAVWYTENYECTLSTDLSDTTIKSLIDSIYERN